MSEKTIETIMERERRRCNVIINGLEGFEENSRLDEGNVRGWLEKKLDIRINTQKTWKTEGTVS